MTFQVRTEDRPTTNPAGGTVYVLEDPGRARLEVWPAGGFNCYSWRVQTAGHTLDLLYCDPQFFQGGKPTRTGIPVLFPFPNRIRAGRFTWQGREYRLPLNDPSGQNAIHGFACRRPWRVIDQGADASAAWVTGAFQGAVDAPDARDLWPADYVLRLTLRLEARALRLLAEVENPDHVPLPFGLGYHPYFHVPAAPGEGPADYRVQAEAGMFWQLEDSLPTGKLLPVDAPRDLRRPRPFPELSLDDVLHAGRGKAHGRVFAEARPTEGVRLEASTDFRELVAFTPPHRQAVALEPYTCTTDAINLQEQGIDAGLLVLPPGQRWRGEVSLSLD